jgi:PAS domain S-box-containing protein
LLILDAERNIRFWSPPAETRFGVTAGEAVGKPVDQVLPAVEYRTLWDALPRARKTGAIFVPIPLEGGAEGAWGLTVTPLSAGNGHEAGFALSGPAPAPKRLADGWAAHRRLKAALCRSEREKEAILNGLGDVVVAYLNREHRILWCNEAMAEKFGRGREEMMGRFCYRVVRGFSHPCPDCAAGKALKTGRSQETEITTPDGRTFLFRGNPVRDEAGNVIGVIHAGLDITSRKAAEEGLQWELRVNRAAAVLSEGLLSTDFSVAEVARLILEQVKSLTDSEHGFVSVIDPETRDMVSHTLTDMLAGECDIPDGGIVFPAEPDGRYSGLWGHALNTMTPFFTNDPDRHPARGELPEGHIPLERFLAVPVAVGDRPAGLIAAANSRRPFTDADLEAVIQLGELYALALQRSQFEQERATLLQQLQQSQKLEAIGALAGGIAHDFNNILFPIIGYAEMALDDTAPDHPHRQFLSQILKGASRARDLVMQILTFSRQTEGERQAMRVQPILKEVLKLIRSTLPATIEVRREVDPETGPILADPTQIHSVLMNLITNAYHAMAETGGVLTVGLANHRISAGDSRPGLRAGHYVRLTVADSGSGMPPEVRDRAFDPYFTTKAQGQGTGLGLSVVHGVVQSCEGHIEIDTAPGRGTRMRVYLPRTDPGVDAMPAGERPEPGNGEHVLVVDDEPAITEMIRRMLEGLNYRVTARNCSMAAWEAVDGDPDQFDLLLADMTMPGLRGDQLTRRIREIRPDLPVILLSGFSELLSDELAEELAVSARLKKPILRSELSRAIRRALSRGRGGAPAAARWD